MEAPLCPPIYDVFPVTLLRGALLQIRSRRPQWIGEVCFSRAKKLMTRRIILKIAAGKHLCQKLSAVDDLLGVLIILERVFRCRYFGRAQRIPSVNKAFSPGLQIVELIPQQLEPTVVILCR